MIFDEFFDCTECDYHQAYDDGDGRWDCYCNMLNDWIIDWSDDLTHENCPLLYGFTKEV